MCFTLFFLFLSGYFSLFYASCLNEIIIKLLDYIRVWPKLRLYKVIHVFSIDGSIDFASIHQAHAHIRMSC